MGCYKSVTLGGGVTLAGGWLYKSKFCSNSEFSRFFFPFCTDIRINKNKNRELVQRPQRKKKYANFWIWTEFRFFVIITYILIVMEEFTINFILCQMPNLDTEQRILHKSCQMQQMPFRAVFLIWAVPQVSPDILNDSTCGTLVHTSFPNLRLSSYGIAKCLQPWSHPNLQIRWYTVIGGTKTTK